MTRLPRGTTQASMPNDADHYVIEQWNGKTWEVIDPGPYATKATADRVGFSLYPAHKK